MAQRDLKPRKDLDTFGNSMLGKLAKESKGRIMRTVSKRRRQRGRRLIDEELDVFTEEINAGWNRGRA